MRASGLPAGNLHAPARALCAFARSVPHQPGKRRRAGGFDLATGRFQLRFGLRHQRVDSSTSSPVFGAYELSSQIFGSFNQAPYTINLANTFFPSKRRKQGNLAVPRLPVDSGQLVLDATQTMTIQGHAPVSTGHWAALGGEVTICASPEDIYIVGPNPSRSTYPTGTGALVLDSSQLTNFGAASLLIGGYRTTTVSGTSVTVTTNNLVVDNNGASTMVDERHRCRIGRARHHLGFQSEPGSGGQRGD